MGPAYGPVAAPVMRVLALAALLVPVGAMAAGLGCQDATAALSGPGDAYNIAAVMQAGRQGLAEADAAAIRNGMPPVTTDWSDYALDAQAVAVLASCRRHPRDGIDQRAAAILAAYRVANRP